MARTCSKVSLCWVCQTHTNKYKILLDKVGLLQCQRCNLIFVDRVYTELELFSFYEKTYFQHDHAGHGYTDYADLVDIKEATFKDRLDLLGRYCSPGKVLDVGCATGVFVEQALQRGWDAYGIDISSFAIKQARKKNSERFHQVTLLEVETPDGSFDSITMFDYIEHLLNPMETLYRTCSLLKPGGVLVIETPNAGGFLAKIMGRRWPYYRPPEHLVYFSPSSLKFALEKAGFELLFTKPSFKAMSLNYISEMLALTNPFLSRLVRWFSLGSSDSIRCAWKVPTGSFLAFARKKD